MSTGISALVDAAAAGDQQAWNALVDRFAGLVWSVARAHRLSEADAADVSQTTWLRLVEHLGRLRDPDRVGAWLAAVARNEALRVVRRNARGVPLADEAEIDSLEPPPELRLLAAERDTALWRAFAELPERCRKLLRLLVSDPEPTYEEVSAALEMPIGSIGPTRARCLERLRRSRELARITEASGGSYQDTR